MPNRRYVARRTGCPRCKAGFEVFERLLSDGLGACPDCGCSVRRSISLENMPQVGAMDPRIDGGYISQVARFRGDPGAHYSGIDSYKRLIDKKQREGYRVLHSSEQLEDAPIEIKRKEKKGVRNGN